MTRIYIIGVAALAVTLFSACSAKHAHDADEHDHAHEAEAAHDADSDDIHFSTEQARAAGLQTERIVPADFAEVIEVSGQVLPSQGSETTISATMAGIVRFAGSRLMEGSAVSASQALFAIDATPIADGNPSAAAQAELSAAQTALQRAEKLAAEKIITQSELEEARRRFQTAESTARSLGNASRQRTVASPMSGFVKNVLVSAGDYVEVGQPLATITQSRRLQLRADVPERAFGRLADVVSANFRMAYDNADRTYSLAELSGRLVTKGNTSAAEEHFVPVVFEFNNAGNILAGSLAQIYLLGRKRSGVLSVPQEAVVEAQGLHFVYVQKSKDLYERREVTLGATDGRRVELTKGVAGGDVVVTRGATWVRLAANASAEPEGHSHG